MTIADWTEQEKVEVLNFFGLDTLEPEVWMDVNEEAGQQAEEAEEMDPAKQAAAKLMGLQASSMNSARQYLQDTRDPLQINDELYVQQLRLRESGPDQADAAKRSLSINSASFHPRHYIRHVHRDTSYDDLLRGIEQLKQSCGLRDDTLKTLVKTNFSRFIDAKNSVELVFADMTTRGLTADDHGLTGPSEAVGQAFQKAERVFQPLLARRSQEETVRKRLRVYEKYSFILSLGGRFEKYVELGDYQQASYDYRKAKALLSEVSQSSTFRRLLDRTWNGHLSKALNEIRSELFKKLSNPIFSYDVHSKMIEYLLELDAHPDPVTFYLEHTKSTLLHQIQVSCTKAVTELTQLAFTRSADSFGRLVELGLAHSIDEILASPEVYSQAWRIRKAFFCNLSDVFQNFTPAFSKFTTALFDGRLLRSDQLAGQRKSVVGDQMPGYIGKLRSFAQQLADEAIKSAQAVLQGREYENATAGCAFAPLIAHSLQLIYMAADSADMSDIMMDQMGQIVSEGTRLLGERLWADSVADVSKLPEAGSWVQHSEASGLSSALLNSFEGLVNQTVSTQAALQKTFDEKLAGHVAFPELGAPHHAHLCRMVTGFVEALEALAVSELVASRLGTGYRLLVILTNLMSVQAETLGQIRLFFEECRLGEVPEDGLARVTAALARVHDHVLDLYQANRRTLLAGIIAEGFASFDWETDFATYAMRPYIDRLLAELMIVQNEILDVSRDILRPIMMNLAACIFKEYFTQVLEFRRLSLSGYLQARLEVEFVARVLVTAMTEETEELVEEIKRQLLQMAGPALAAQAADLDQVLASKVAILAEQTSMQYVCFQYT